MALFYAIFFASGFAALLYETIWQRVLTFFGGADVYAATIIVAAFMGGLGLGSLAGGHLADRLSVRGRLLAFAAAELAIALFAVVSLRIYYDLLYVRLGQWALSYATVSVLVFLTALWPTFFMGISLPLLAKALTPSTQHSAQRIGGLYGWNTFGAAVGALATVWIIVRSVGFESAVRVGALLNLTCAVAAVLATLTVLRRPTAVMPAGGEAPQSASAAPYAVAFPLLLWMMLYALAGFIALSLEILWFRILGIMLKSNSFTFATLLAIYLAGLGVGALVGSRFARRSARPISIFLCLQAAVTLYAGLSLAVLTSWIDRLSFAEPLWRHLASYEPLPLAVALRALAGAMTGSGTLSPLAAEQASLFVTLYAILPLYLIGPSTVFMGMSFAFLQRATQTDFASLGRRVGWLQAANIAGSMLGAAATGLVLLGWIGSSATLRLLVVLGAIFLLLACRTMLAPRSRLRPPAFAAALALVGLVCWLAPGSALLWSKLHGAEPAAVLFAEDGSGVAVLKDDANGPQIETIVYANGIGQSWLPFSGRGNRAIHTQLGALPTLLHPDPRTIAVIGLGSGDTVFASGGRPETERIDCVEIVGPQLLTLQLLHQRHDYPGLTMLLADPRVRYTFTDGRAFIMHGGAYDVIEADALRPTSAFAGNLYSYEYFRLLGEHLTPGGFAVSWAPTARTLDTFVKAFPHVLVFGHILIGSNDAIAFDSAVMRERLRAPFTQSYYARGGVDVAAALAPLIDKPPVDYGPNHDRTRLTDLNLDLFPKDEYRAFGSSDGAPPAR